MHKVLRRVTVYLVISCFFVIALGQAANAARIAYVWGSTTAGWNGLSRVYEGKVTFKKVRNAFDQQVSSTVARKARLACYRSLFANQGDPGVFPHVLVHSYHQNWDQPIFLTSWTSWGTTEFDAEGNWIQDGYSIAQFQVNDFGPVTAVIAKGGFWEDYYFYRQSFSTSKFKAGDRKWEARCLAWDGVVDPPPPVE